MDKYNPVQLLGDGSFGTVTQAQHRLTGEQVAIKKFKQKYYSYD